MKPEASKVAFWLIVVLTSLLLGIAAFALYAYYPATISQNFRLVHTIPLCFLFGFAIGHPQRGAIAALLLSLSVTIGLTVEMQSPDGKTVPTIVLLFLIVGSLSDGLFGWQGAKCRQWMLRRRAV